MNRTGIQFLKDMIDGTDEKRRQKGVEELLKLSGHTAPTGQAADLTGRSKAVREAINRTGK